MLDETATRSTPGPTGSSGLTTLFCHTIPPGAAWTLSLSAGRVVLLTASAGANLTTLVFGPDRLDRLSVPDTLTAQLSACVAAPMVLLGDRGLALCSVVGSSLPWHDAVSGMGSERHLPPGPTSYQRDRNDWRRSARALLLGEMRKHGFGELDLHAPVNFFSRVTIAPDQRGSLAYDGGYAKDGDWVCLRAEQDVVIVMSTAPHPLDPMWAPGAVTAEVLAGALVGADDPVRLQSEQADRALEQTGRAHA